MILERKPEILVLDLMLSKQDGLSVLKTISECNLQNYSIFLYGDLVFSYYEYVGEDYDADMAKMAADPITQDWWKCTHPCFETYAMDPGSEFYHDMKPIFYHK